LDGQLIFPLGRPTCLIIIPNTDRDIRDGNPIIARVSTDRAVCDDSGIHPLDHGIIYRRHRDRLRHIPILRRKGERGRADHELGKTLPPYGSVPPDTPQLEIYSSFGAIRTRPSHDFTT